MSSSLSILPVRVRKGRRPAVADTGNDGRDTGRGGSESRDAVSTHLVPKNRKTPRAVARGAPGSARPDELVLAIIALAERRVDRCRERRIVELEAQIFRAGLARRLGPGRPELDARCADPVVGRLLVVALAGADTRLEAKRQGADFAGVEAVFAQCDAAKLFPENHLQVIRCRPL